MEAIQKWPSGERGGSPDLFHCPLPVTRPTCEVRDGGSWVLINVSLTDFPRSHRALAFLQGGAHGPQSSTTQDIRNPRPRRGEQICAKLPSAGAPRAKVTENKAAAGGCREPGKTIGGRGLFWALRGHTPKESFLPTARLWPNIIKKNIFSWTVCNPNRSREVQGPRRGRMAAIQSLRVPCDSPMVPPQQAVCCLHRCSELLTGVGGKTSFPGGGLALKCGTKRPCFPGRNELSRTMVVAFWQSILWPNLWQIKLLPTCGRPALHRKFALSFYLGPKGG